MYTKNYKNIRNERNVIRRFVLLDFLLSCLLNIGLLNFCPCWSLTNRVWDFRPKKLPFFPMYVVNQTLITANRTLPQKHL